MTLTLTLVRCPDQVPPQSRALGGGELRIGRAADNDWVLPDPDRHLSKRHCAVAFMRGEWQVTDLSTNGTFLNREDAAIGPGRVRELRDGDRLRLGTYEIEVRIAARVAHPDIEPFGGLTPYDPLGTSPGEYGFDGPVQADHSPGIEDAFVPPRPISVLDDDWDFDELAPVVPAPAPAPAAVAAPPQVAETGQDDLLAAFLRGAGLPNVRPADPAATMEAMGAALRATVSGLREALIARSSIKGEFRIEQTMLRAKGNNPLKFSTGDDDALAALLGVGRHNGLPAPRAIGDALRDMRLHELATVSAMQSAVRLLLAELSPVKLRDAAERGGVGLLPAQRKARAWDAFEALHAKMLQALSDDFDSVFGRAFARAYERALREAAREDPT